MAGRGSKKVWDLSVGDVFFTLGSRWTIREMTHDATSRRVVVVTEQGARISMDGEDVVRVEKVQP